MRASARSSRPKSGTIGRRTRGSSPKRSARRVFAHARSRACRTPSAKADIISCATLSPAPLIAGAWLRAGQHLDLVGAFNMAMREADDLALQRARVFVDTPAALNEGGDVAQAIANGALAPQRRRRRSRRAGEGRARPRRPRGDHAVQVGRRRDRGPRGGDAGVEEGGSALRRVSRSQCRCGRLCHPRS